MAQVNSLKLKQLREYGEDGIRYVNESKFLSKYIARKAVASESSAKTIRARLNRFGLFILKKYGGNLSFDSFITGVQSGNPDPYDLLADYAEYMTNNKNKPNEIRQKVRAAKKFLRFCKVRIDNEDFRENVSLPRQEFPEFDGVEKAQIVELLNACKNQRLRTALMMFASTGCRAIEGCAVKMSDLDLDKGMITFPARYTKTRKERTRPMTRELVSQIKLWLKVKYRPHTWVHVDGKRELIDPQPKDDDLILAMWHYSEMPRPEGIYLSIYDEYEDVANRLEMPRKNGRRVIGFHSLRRFVKSVISDLGHSDYSEYFIGHSGSTYYRKSDRERAEIFKKIEPYLTFVDVASLEAKGADVSTKLEASEERYTKLAEQSSLMMAYMLEPDAARKEAIAADMIQKGYLPRQQAG